MKRLSLAALTALFASIGCCDQDSIPSNISKLSSGNTRDRSLAAQELSRCGSSAKNAVGPLSGLLYDDNVGVQSAAAYALRKIDTKEAREILERIETKRRASRENR
jgi:HEAT repeat protein